MTNFQNFHILLVKYIGPTNYKPSRVKIISERFNKSVTIDYNHDFNNTLDIAEDWAVKNGFNIVGHGELDKASVIVTDTFIAPKSK